MVNAVYNRIPDIVESFIKQDNNEFEMATLTLIRLLEKKDPKVAIQLKKSLSDYHAGKSGVQESRTISATENELLTAVTPTKGLDDLVISTEVRNDIEEIIKSHKSKEALQKVGLNPITKVLFSGPSGTGKSSAAEVIATKLALPLYRVNTAQLLSSYLGDTSKNVASIITYVRTHRVVLLLDEFDSIGGNRNDATDVGEMRRIVNTLLQSLDAWENRGIFIATTNRLQDIDDALFRRFDLNIRFSSPDVQARYALWLMYLGDYVDNRKLKEIAELIDNVSPAEIEILSQRALRQSVLNDVEVVPILIQFLRRPLEQTKQNKKNISQALKKIDPTLTLLQISELTGTSTSSVSRYLHEN
ncbi:MULTISPECIES: AAA family ATPase [Lactiplantibacillus]|uniref:AAA family ATPase n=1 Tax=Lactiplantibacillus TaxID=2767842 RepID=UPI001C1FBFA5|nr:MULTISPECIES: AAA family ATPase [Lactiplantibacillus]MBU7449252.1 ATP-binding protein [Lactiplantibacillus sp. 7.2.4]MBU7481587.1 ATP-binding protein [Lactiplantibacillus pentosus]